MLFYVTINCIKFLNISINNRSEVTTASNTTFNSDTLLSLQRILDSMKYYHHFSTWKVLLADAPNDMQYSKRMLALIISSLSLTQIKIDKLINLI